MEKDQIQKEEKEQWRGAAEALLPSTPAAAAWPHVVDFFALHRYLPGIDVCSRADTDFEDSSEVPVRPGCVRYCASFAPGTAEVGTWAREELVELDPLARRLVYAVVGSNMGFGRYVASLTVLPVMSTEADGGGGGEVVVEEDAQGLGSGGCRLVWAFECEPVQGWTRDGLLGYLDGAVKSMAARIEEAENGTTTAAAAAVPLPPVVPAEAEGGAGGGAGGGGGAVDAAA